MSALSPSACLAREMLDFEGERPNDLAGEIARDLSGELVLDFWGESAN